MRKYSIAVIAAFVIAGITSCKHVKEPESADFSWYYYSDYSANMIDLSKASKNPKTIELSDQICFVANDASANSYVVWTGEPGHAYEDRELSDDLKKDTVNNVAKKATGVALSTRDGKGRFMKTYNFNSISPSSSPFQMYCTARNYDYESGEYKEIKAGPYSIEVVDTQTDLWDMNDPYNEGGGKNYAIQFKIGSKKISTTNKTGGDYKVDYETPGIIVTYNKGLDVSKCEITLKVNKCIPFSEQGTFTYNVRNKQYAWTVDLTKSPVLTLASQSAVKEGYLNSYADKAIGDEGVDSKGYIAYTNDKSQLVEGTQYTKDYTFKAIEAE